jgi:hypothetical protein
MCSARRSDLCRTTHSTRERQSSMPPVGSEPAIPASERRKDARLKPLGHWDRPGLHLKRYFIYFTVCNHVDVFSLFGLGNVPKIVFSLKVAVKPKFVGPYINISSTKCTLLVILRHLTGFNGNHPLFCDNIILTYILPSNRTNL